MRYRRDVPVNDTAALVATAGHIRAHLSAVADPDDNPKRFNSRVRMDVDSGADTGSGVIALVGELNAQPRAVYLTDDYDPDTDHPEITFQPYEEPELGHFAEGIPQ